MDNLDTNKRHTKSPLYTAKAEAERKAKLLKHLGPDKDGAYRAYGRIDRADKETSK